MMSQWTTLLSAGRTDVSKWKKTPVHKLTNRLKGTWDVRACVACVPTFTIVVYDPSLPRTINCSFHAPGGAQWLADVAWICYLPLSSWKASDRSRTALL